MPTLIDLICEVARSKNLDTSDVVVWALNDLESQLDFRNPVSAAEFGRLVASLQAAGTQRANCAKELLEHAYNNWESRK